MTTEQMARHIEHLKKAGKTNTEIKAVFGLGEEFYRAMLEKYMKGANDNEKK